MRCNLAFVIIAQILSLGGLFWSASSTVMAEELRKDTELGSITNVQDFIDVYPTDWAYSALQNLLETYGHPQGYKDKTFRGNRPLSRYEFAAALNGLLVQILDSNKLSRITRSDLEILQRLQADFASELTVLQSRLPNLETRLETIESDQFSTTTKLGGEVVFASTTALGEEKAVPEGISTNSSEDVEENITFSGRVRLFLNTSFTGQDLLRVRLLAGNIQNLRAATGTNMARLSFDSNTNNNVIIDQLFYQFPVGESARVTIMPVGTLFTVADPINPLLGRDGTGSPFLFGVRSPIYREEIGGTGAGISYDISPELNASLVYLAEDAEQPSSGSGLFNGAFSALGQLTWKPNSRTKLGLVYSRSFNGIDINAGGLNTNAPFADASQSITGDSYGIVANWRINDDVSLGGWGGWVRTTAQDLTEEPTAEILYYAVTLAFPDLAKEGDLAGLVFGQPPRLISNEFSGIDEPDPAFNLEAFYRFPVSDHLSITPGLLVIINPEHNSNNETLYIGTIRTTWSF